MCRYRGRTSELRIRVHTAQSIGETIRSGTCSHVIGMQSTSGTAAGCNGEVLLACFQSLLLVSTGYGMLESGRIGRVTGDGYVYVLLPHDSYTFGNAVSAVAVNLSTKSLRVSNSLYLGNGIGVRIIRGLYKSKSVDTGNDLCSVLTKTVQDNT